MKVSISFDKYEAAGNDFIIMDARTDPQRLEFARRNGRILCDRHFGIGADGILVIADKISCDHADAAMHIVNADGSTAAMCGNGIRCIARYLFEHGEFDISSEIRIDTLGGLQTVRYLSAQDDIWQIAVQIAQVRIGTPVHICHDGRDYNGLSVDVGNPHAVFEVHASPREILDISGAYLSHHKSFPDRSNIELIREMAQDEIELAVYERGVGPTLACGTGCTAAAAAYCASRNRSGVTVRIHAPGGDLSVCIPKTGQNRKIELRGPARRVFSGQWMKSPD